MSKTTIKSVKLMLLIKLLALAGALIWAPGLAVLTAGCYIGAGRSLGRETKAGMSRFVWTLIAFLFLAFCGCFIIGMYPSIPCTPTDMAIISSAWLVVFGIPLDLMELRGQLRLKQANDNLPMIIEKQKVVVDAEIVD